MCVGLPGKVIEIKGKEAKIEQGDHFHWVDFSSVGEEIKIGDYLITYQEAAINKVSVKEAEEVLKLMDSACDTGIKRAD